MADHEVRENVRQRYAGRRCGRAGRQRGVVLWPGRRRRLLLRSDPATSAGPLEFDELFGAGLYGAETEGLPAEAVLASLGCGNPLFPADLRPGEQVLDQGLGPASTCCSRPAGAGPTRARLRARHDRGDARAGRAPTW